MKIQDHFLAVDRDEQADKIRFYAVLKVNNPGIESPRFHEKKLAEQWLAIQIKEYRNA